MAAVAALLSESAAYAAGQWASCSPGGSACIVADSISGLCLTLSPTYCSVVVPYVVLCTCQACPGPSWQCGSS